VGRQSNTLSTPNAGDFARFVRGKLESGQKIDSEPHLRTFVPSWTGGSAGLSPLRNAAGVDADLPIRVVEPNPATNGGRQPIPSSL
jgi:hypothetical protein